MDFNQSCKTIADALCSLLLWNKKRKIEPINPLACNTCIYSSSDWKAGLVLHIVLDYPNNCKAIAQQIFPECFPQEPWSDIHSPCSRRSSLDMDSKHDSRAVGWADSCSCL